MYYGRLDRSDMINGDGVHVSLFVSGCRTKCKGCHNPESWDFKYGEEYTDETLKQVLEFCNNDYISGVSILGGEPMEKENKTRVEELACAIKTFHPDKKVWLWTSHRFEDLDIHYDNYDVIIDGPYIESLPTTKKYRGSDNQRFWEKEVNEFNDIIWRVVD